MITNVKAGLHRGAIRHQIHQSFPKLERQDLAEWLDQVARGNIPLRMILQQEQVAMVRDFVFAFNINQRLVQNRVAFDSATGGRPGNARIHRGIGDRAGPRVPVHAGDILERTRRSQRN